MNTPPYYGIQLLDDLHNHFPAILYNPRQFLTVADVLEYIQTQTRNHFDRFSNAQRNYSSQQPQSQPQQTQPQQRPRQTSSDIPRIPVRFRTTTATATTQPQGRFNPLLRVLRPLSSSEGEIGGGMTADIIASLFNLGSVLGADEMDITSIPMEPVPVIPTAEQIQSATSLSSATVANELVACSICQDNFAVGQEIRRIHHCNHEFHRGCIDTWFQTNVACPMCRWDIRGHQDHNSSNEV